MIAIIILILVGRGFYQLAKQNNIDNPWIYFIAPIAVYYGTSIVIGLIIGLMSVMFFPDLVDADGELSGSAYVFALIGSIGGGIGAIILLYNYLKKRWTRREVNEDLLDETVTRV
ncbi:MAG: hypothetical protein HWE14_14830 [Flavobacteriia bacterium]|nr:hypothetical protein [Flavobacteriia bacterium]